MERIGVIGLGRMGSAIARRMTTEGLNVAAWTRSGRPVDGVNSAPDLETLVQHSDTLILNLLDDVAVADMLDAILMHDLTGKQIIETSTVTPGLLIDRIDAITTKGASAVDAPISGGPELVLAGACGVFIGGNAASAARAREPEPDFPTHLSRGAVGRWTGHEGRQQRHASGLHRRPCRSAGSANES